MLVTNGEQKSAFVFLQPLFNPANYIRLAKSKKKKSKEKIRKMELEKEKTNFIYENNYLAKLTGMLILRLKSVF